MCVGVFRFGDRGDDMCGCAGLCMKSGFFCGAGLTLSTLTAHICSDQSNHLVTEFHQ